MRAYEFIQEHGKRDVSAALCKSTRHLGSSDQSQCVAKGLRAHHNHKTIAGEKIYGKKEPHRIYGGKKINSPL